MSSPWRDSAGAHQKNMALPRHARVSSMYRKLAKVYAFSALMSGGDAVYVISKHAMSTRLFSILQLSWRDGVK